MTVSLRLGPALLDRLDEAAERAERPRTECIEEAIETWLGVRTETDDELRARVLAILRQRQSDRDLWPPCERCGGVSANERAGEPPLGLPMCQCETPAPPEG